MKNYRPAPDSKAADLLLILSWGKTVPFDDASERASTEGTFAAMSNLKTANEAVKLNEAQGELSRSPDGIRSPTRYLRDAAASALEGELRQMQMFAGMRNKADEQNSRLLGYVQEINENNNPSRFAGWRSLLRRFDFGHRERALVM